MLAITSGHNQIELTLHFLLIECLLLNIFEKWQLNTLQFFHFKHISLYIKLMLLYSILIQFFLSFNHSFSLHLIFLMLHRYCTLKINGIRLRSSLACVNIISIQVIICIFITLLILIIFYCNIQIVVRIFYMFNYKSSLLFFNFKFLQFILLLQFYLLLTPKSLL